MEGDTSGQYCKCPWRCDRRHRLTPQLCTQLAACAGSPESVRRCPGVCSEFFRNVLKFLRGSRRIIGVSSDYQIHCTSTRSTASQPIYCTVGAAQFAFGTLPQARQKPGWAPAQLSTPSKLRTNSKHTPGNHRANSGQPRNNSEKKIWRPRKLRANSEQTPSVLRATPN